MVLHEGQDLPGTGRLTAEDRLLICSAGIAPRGASNKPAGGMPSAELDWDGLVEKSLRHGVASLLHLYLSRPDTPHRVPIGVSRRLGSIYYANAVRALRAEEQLADIVGWLGGNGVEAMLLKGLFLSEALYQNMALRPVGDIDLLIHRSDVARVDGLLRKIGFSPAPGSLPLRYYREIHFHRLYVRGPGPEAIPLEVHWDLKDRFHLLRVNMDEIWDGARPWSTGRCTVSAMGRTDLLIYLCYHAEKHACFSRYIDEFSPLGPEVVLENTVSAELLWYADVLRLIGLDGHAMEWELVAAKSRRWGVEGEVYASLAVTDRVFGTAFARRALELLPPPRTRRLQASIYRRLMAPPDPAQAAGPAEGTKRHRLLRSAGGLQFRPFRLLDILDYMFPAPDRVSRCFSVSGARLSFRYARHVLTATLDVISCLGLFTGSLIWASVMRRAGPRLIRSPGKE
jgi:hypothetical protein